jgi:hypothetical protein
VRSASPERSGPDRRRRFAPPKLDAEDLLMFVDELAHQRCCGSSSRAKKVVAAFRISTVRSNSAFLRLSSRI